ncbi:NACHT domain-containing protein [Micromonospora sp. DT44]|uniref:NACHT domain-containing protein n=1 Tax=Micromonospora sp. DT44 TaxID=3393439 RepID=UPI003CF75254
METLFRLASAVVTPAVRWWLADRQKKKERTLPLRDLIDVKLSDNFRKREITREVAALCDVVEERLTPLIEVEFSGLAKAEKLAAINAVANTFTLSDLTDEAIFASDMQPDALARKMKNAMQESPAKRLLSDKGERLYEVLLSECCTCYIRLVQQLAPFQSRAISELLSRVTGLSSTLRDILDRVPRRTLDSPAGDDFDNEFLHRYLGFLSEQLDAIELFGIDVRNFRPTTAVSIAYVSLSVTTSGAGPTRYRSRRTFEPGAFSRGINSDKPSGLVSVEEALAAASRVIVRGEAGSGKSTLLRWLAVTAARGHWTSELIDWRGSVPFLVKLRSYAGRDLPKPSQFLDNVADVLTDIMPDRWVHRQLNAGKALLLIDGVDELSVKDRPKVRDWLRRLVVAYPKLRVIVTSRPAAATSTWLEAEGFVAADLEKMGPAEVKRFIAHWHDAIRSAGGFPCEERELPHYERSLLSRFDADPHLAVLATTPLLCAMLCALNLDKRSQLPRDRLGVYNAALDLLIERREVMREIPSYSDLPLETAQKLHLLRHLAWRMSVNGRAEEDQSQAEHRVAEKLAAMQIKESPSDVVAQLVQRSGVLRSPSLGRIDFVHRTFQEYLTALESAEQGDIELLAEKAHLDQWRDIVIMAVGCGNNPFRIELLSHIRRRVEAEPRHARQLRVVVASCFEAVPAPPPQMLEFRDSSIAELIPPRGLKEAQSLALIGTPLLNQLPQNLSDLSEAQAAAVIRTVALINGRQALDYLGRNSRDPRDRVQLQLIRAWAYFDPEEYSRTVLADAPLLNGEITISDERHLPFAKNLSGLANLRLALHNITDLSLIEGLPHLSTVTAAGSFYDLRPLEEHASSLRYLSLDSAAESVDLGPLSRLKHLADLHFFSKMQLDSLDFLEEWPGLESLGLSGAPEVSGLTPIAGMKQLVSLELRDSMLFSADGLGSRLHYLQLENTRLSDSFFTIAEFHPQLYSLTLYNAELKSGLKGMWKFQELDTLTLAWLKINDLSPLAALQKLKKLFIWTAQRYLIFHQSPALNLYVRCLCPGCRGILTRRLSSIFERSCTSIILRCHRIGRWA